MIKRKLLTALISHLNKREISLITGPRQAGKTTLMQMLRGHVEKKGLGRTLFLSLDNELDRGFFTSQALLLQKVALELGTKGGYVFIDEIQRKENAGIFLKGIYDQNLPYKFIVSGSGSLELKESVHESLVGRKRVFELSTISFEEFANHKTNYSYEDKLADFFSVEKQRVSMLLGEYLACGGYPKVVLEETLEEKQKNINEIYESYLIKDISFLLRVERTDAFKGLIKILAAQIGRLANYEELSSAIGISQQTVKNYLWYSEQTFVTKKLTPFFRNVKKEISKSPIFYFDDLGLRNYCIGSFGMQPSAVDGGYLFQNFILNIIRETVLGANCDIHFWRTKDKAEVDFVVETGVEIIPVEVKFSSFARPKIERPLRSFIARYRPSRALVVNKDFEEKLVLDDTEIVFLPFWRLLNYRWIV